MIKFWAKTLSGKQEKLPAVLYKLVFRQYGSDVVWHKYIKQILDDCGMSFIWNAQTVENINWLHANVKQTLIDQFRQFWISDIQNSSKSLNYRIFKNDLKIEHYFKLLDDKNVYTLCRFRTLNHKLPIEAGRWQNIERDDRKCHLCNNSELGDEYHYIFTCSFFNNDRKKFINNYFRNRPNILKFHDLMNSTNLTVLNNLCKFIRIINKQFSLPG